ERFREAGLWVENGAGVEARAVKPRFKVDPAVFIETRSVQAFRELVLELLSGETLLGPTLGAVTGLTGRGKSTAAKHIAATTERVVYLRALPFWSTTDLLREICFALAGERPRYKAKCMELIARRTQARRRLLIVDEADGLTLREHLNPLRGLNEVCQMPVILVGEERLPEVLREERRLWHRVRRVVVFSDITPGDLVLFWKEAVGIQLGREVAEALFRRCGGDFRLVVGDAENACRLLNALGATEMTMEIVSRLPELKPE
ncbi:MAG TPA: ATP-binding protein, partial [Candidatus Latescibacteria bacterium]|nr:ATP-binding protein [Candidatus Latescibacterota bacterium]